MHEASIAMSIMNIARAAMKEHGNARVELIEVAIGQLRAIEPELLMRSFTYLAKGTVCEAARLLPNVIPVTARCHSCETVSHISKFRFECEACGNTDLEILSGQELRVEKITAVPLPDTGSEMMQGQIEREPVR